MFKKWKKEMPIRELPGRLAVRLVERARHLGLGASRCEINLHLIILMKRETGARCPRLPRTHHKTTLFIHSDIFI